MGHLILLRPSRVAVVSTTPHLSTEDAASYLDGTLSDEARTDVERHLAECDSCREELAASARLIATVPAPPRRQLAWRLVVPIAAGLLLAIVLRRPARHVELPAGQERGASSDASHITLVSPSPDATIAAGSPRFAWRAMAGSIGYRVVIKDASGAPVWSGDAADTLLVLPAETHLRAGQSYLWRVDGQRADGTTASSAEAGFQVVR
jgi:anti-sigma factor RsiW